MLLSNPNTGRFVTDPTARHINAEGYVMVKDPRNPHGRKYRLEHRVVCEMLLGRSLKASEVVHHHDGNRQNNIAENLIVETPSHHRRLHLSKDRDARIIDGIEHRCCFICQQTSPITIMKPRQGQFVHFDCIKKYQRENSQRFRDRHKQFT